MYLPRTVARSPTVGHVPADQIRANERSVPSLETPQSEIEILLEVCMQGSVLRLNHTTGAESPTRCVAQSGGCQAGKRLSSRIATEIKRNEKHNVLSELLVVCIQGSAQRLNHTAGAAGSCTFNDHTI